MLGVVQKAAPILICYYLCPLLVPFYGKGLQLIQLLGAQRNPSALKVVDMICGDTGSSGRGGMQVLTIITVVGS